jgi:Secretion system C-terminal sorting domain
MNLRLLLSTTFIATSFGAFAQDANTTYAITGDGNGDFMWMNIRKVDISTGKIVQDVFQRAKTSFVMMDATTKQPVEQTINHKGQNYNTPVYPTATMVAAAAYDKNHDKLFFTPMRIGELRWLDLGAKGESQKFYTVKTAPLNSNESLMDEANHFTRMVIGADGNGYAVTNDANRLIRFTTGKKVTVTDLGNLIDDESNKGVSIHNKCSSWGGDMIADAYNKLYIISANHYVFVVDLDTRVAKHIGNISGLPANYTTNGAAVDKEGAIVVSSANMFAGYYKFKLADLAAVKIEGSDMVYNASDLANGNLLLQKEADAAKNFGAADFRQVVPVITPNAHIFPNPVTGGEFKIHFDGQQAGKYNVTVTDLSGKAIMNRVVNVATKNQVETVPMNSKMAKGVYMVKVTDASNKFIFTERIVVQ